MKVIALFSLNTNKFKGRYEMNKFYRGLYGWKQTVVKGNKRYEYIRDGILSEIDYTRPLKTSEKRISGSAIILEKKHLNKVIDYFKRWSNKVIYKFYEIRG